jgi:hypothetical protein
LACCKLNQTCPGRTLYHNIEAISPNPVRDSKAVHYKNKNIKKNSTKPDYPHKGAGIDIGMQKLGQCTGSYSEA